MIKHSLSIYNFPRGILDFLLHLVFFLDRAKLDKSKKIGFVFFWAIFNLLHISKLQNYFWIFLKMAKRLNSGSGYVYTDLYTEGRLVRLTCGPWDPHVSVIEGEVARAAVFRRQWSPEKVGEGMDRLSATRGVQRGRSRRGWVTGACRRQASAAGGHRRRRRWRFQRWISTRL